MRLFLFDIGGVLVKAGAVSFDYWRAVVGKHFSLSVSKERAYTSGKTDRQILCEFLSSSGIDDPEADPRFERALMDVGRVFKSALGPTRLRPLGGTEALLSRLSEAGHGVGLLTGNTYEKARAKLESAGMWKRFSFGAFGNQSAVRSELVPLAVRAARARFGGRFRGDEVYVVGDTVLDVRCAREAGAKSVAVATGTNSFSELAAEDPDFLFPDLADAGAVAGALLGAVGKDGKPRGLRAVSTLSRSTRTCFPAGRFSSRGSV